MLRRDYLVGDWVDEKTKHELEVQCPNCKAKYKRLISLFNDKFDRDYAFKCLRCNTELKRRTRPAWHDTFAVAAFIFAGRSLDDQTRHGAIITDSRNRVLGVGYNGPPAGMKDEDIPTLRPDKYPWMLHSERNAVVNCQIRPEGGTCWVTGEPCNECLMYMWQAGVTTVNYVDTHGSKLLTDKTRLQRERLLAETGMKVQPFSPNPLFLLEIVQSIIPVEDLKEFAKQILAA